MSRSATRFAAIYGSRPLHLLTIVSGLALLGYVLVTFSPATLWNPGTWWQSIAVWFAAAVVAHDLVLFPSTRWPTGCYPSGPTANRATITEKCLSATTFAFPRWGLGLRC
jgi:hypothetical protein